MRYGRWQEPNVFGETVTISGMCPLHRVWNTVKIRHGLFRISYLTCRSF